MASPNSTFTELVTTSLRYRKKEFADNITEHNALLRYMKERGNIKVKGGTEIVLPLLYPENSTYTRYSGTDPLNIQESEVITSAKYDWMQAAIHVVASGRDIRINSGEEAILDLVDGRVTAAMSTAANNMSIDIYSDGALSNQIGGLGHLVTTAGTGTVGGINSTDYTWWQNKTKEVTGTGATYATLRAALNEKWYECTRGMDHPDVIIMSHDFMAIYEGGLQDLARYQDEKAATMGFTALKYKTASVFFDDNTNFGTTAETAFMLNTKYLYLIEHPEARWESEDDKVPINQDMVIKPMYWMGNLCCSNRSLQAKIVDAS